MARTVALVLAVGMGFGSLRSSLVVGGTFMGTPTIAIPAARRLVSRHGAKLVALTPYYSGGQVRGPLLFARVLEATGTLAATLIAAALALLVAVALAFRLEIPVRGVP